MIEFFVKRPVTTIMFVSLLVILGIVSFFNLNLDKQPKVEFPLITISFVYPGASPAEMESLVINKVEDAVSELSEVKKIRSQSYENFGLVLVQFLLSADSNTKFIEVKDKIDALANKFPKGMQKPIVQKFDPFVQPVMEMALTSSSLDEKALYDYADKTLKDRLLAIKDVASVEIIGGQERQINVRLDPMLMKEHYISTEDVLGMMQTQNMNIPSGEIENTLASYNVKFVGEFESMEDIAKVSLITRNGEIVPLSSIATIEDGYKKIEKVARLNGKNALILSVKKSSDSNAVNIGRQIQRKMKDFTASLPTDTSLDIVTDNTKVIIRENINTEMDILIGIVLTVVILFLFTGNVRLTFIASLIIPISIIATFFLMDAFDFTINFLTLLALASALGTLISNAIVIIDSFWLHLKQGKNSFDAAIQGTKEVTSAILAATGTNLVVFLPIAFMKGIIGRFMFSFGMTVVFVTIFSLVVSFILTPMLCCYLLKNAKPTRFVPLRRTVEFLIKKYEKLFHFIFRFPKWTVVAVLIFFVSVRYVTPYISGNFFPRSDEDKFIIKSQTPQGSSLDYTLSLTQRVEEIVRNIPELESYISLVGIKGAENSSVTVHLSSREKRKRKDTEIITSIISKLSQIADLDVSIIRGAQKGFDEGDMTLAIYGNDYDKMIDLSQKMEDKMIATGYFQSISSSYKKPKKELCFLPNTSTLLENGIRDVQVGAALRTALYGDDNNIYKEGGKEYNISVKMNDRYVRGLDDIHQIHLITRNGLLPITSLGRIEKREAVPPIVHEDKQRVIKLDGMLGKSNPSHMKKILEKEFKDLTTEDAWYVFSGADETQRESALEIVKAFFLAVVLTYMLLAALLNSFSYPISIILSVATSFIGVYYTLFFLEESINIASMLGMVMLVGLVVNNSILLVDSTIQKMAALDLKQALWEASKERFQMILMTSLAIVFGVVPQLHAIEETKSSMGAVMMGGMLASILFTFVLTPIVFYYIEKIKRVFSRFFSSKKGGGSQSMDVL
ncbi:MAG: efflux RND transporter permease subunit [Parachlamydiales bacterium]|nr:efflux RND transporter permease subunit [Parachlamydiales bacterium]